MKSAAINCFLYFSLISSISISQTATAPSGTGTSGNPYQISTLNNLYWLSQNSSEWASGKYFAQTADINAVSTNVWVGNFPPIGTSGTPFSAYYDGQNYTINNIIIAGVSTDYRGLFGYMSGGTVRQLNIFTMAVAGNDYIGAVAGYAVSSVIERVSVTGVVTGRDYTGGIVGYIEGAGMSVNRVTTNVVVTGRDYTGGIAGIIDGDLNNLALECGSTLGSVTYVAGGTGYIGGIAGAITGSGSIRGSSVVGSVTGVGKSYVGGVVGFLENGSITESYAAGAIVATTSNNYGGLAGYVNNSTISNCFSVSPTASGDSNAGGLIGQAVGSSIDKCYSSVLVTGTGSNIGGMVGKQTSSTATNSFWYTALGGPLTSALGTVKTFLQMTDIATYTDLATPGLTSPWDFVGNPNDDVGSDDFWNISAILNSGLAYSQNDYCATYVALPIELLSFYIETENQAPLLIWKTATERNSSSFEIWKKNEGPEWHLASQIMASGNSLEPIQYSWSDDLVDEQTTYYQLISIDQDGTKDASEILSYAPKNKTNDELKIYPNPIHNTAKLILSNKEEEEIVSIEIYDLLGRNWSHAVDFVSVQKNKYNILPKSLEPGLYQLKYGERSISFVYAP